MSGQAPHGIGGAEETHEDADGPHRGDPGKPADLLDEAADERDAIKADGGNRVRHGAEPCTAGHGDRERERDLQHQQRQRARHTRWSQAADHAGHEENAGRQHQQIRERQQKMAGPLAKDDLRAVDRFGRERLHHPGVDFTRQRVDRQQDREDHGQEVRGHEAHEHDRRQRALPLDERDVPVTGHFPVREHDRDGKHDEKCQRAHGSGEHDAPPPCLDQREVSNGDHIAHLLIRGASPLGLRCTLSRAPLRRRAPFAWLTRCTRSLGIDGYPGRSSSPMTSRKTSSRDLRRG